MGRWMSRQSANVGAELDTASSAKQLCLRFSRLSNPHSLRRPRDPRQGETRENNIKKSTQDKRRGFGEAVLPKCVAVDWGAVTSVYGVLCTEFCVRVLPVA